MAFSKFVSVFSLAALFFSVNALADRVDSNGARCVRNLTYDFLMKPGNGWLTAAQQADLRAGKQVTAFFNDKSGYVIGYVFRASVFDPELVMSVYSRCDQHAGANGLGAFVVKSNVLASDPVHPGNPFRVFYEQHVDVFSNGKYTVENTIMSSGGSYELSSRLVDSSDDSFSPRWADGFFKVMPQGTGSFTVACNHMVPRGSSFQDKFNDTSRVRLSASGASLMRWVSRVSLDNAAANEARERLRKILQ